MKTKNQLMAPAMNMFMRNVHIIVAISTSCKVEAYNNHPWSVYLPIFLTCTLQSG